MKNIHPTDSVVGTRIPDISLGETPSAATIDWLEVALELLVRTHPVSRRKALYFGKQITVGVVGCEQTRAGQFVSCLTKHACQPAFQYRHKWSVGDAVLWDNRRVLHAGTYYDVKHNRRLMHRITLGNL